VLVVLVTDGAGSLESHVGHHVEVEGFVDGELVCDAFFLSVIGSTSTGMVMGKLRLVPTVVVVIVLVINLFLGVRSHMTASCRSYFELEI
jgi:hypothetical protein